MTTTDIKALDSKLNTYRAGPDDQGFFGLFGGRYVAETLMPLILDLDKAYAEAKADPAFRAEMDGHLKHYVGRPSPLYYAERLSEFNLRHLTRFAEFMAAEFPRVDHRGREAGLVNVHIHQFQPGGAVVDAAALAQFQQQWATYGKLVASDCLSQREVSGILHDTLNEVFKQPFSFLDIACGDASMMKTALRGTKVRHYHGIDLSQARGLSDVAEALTANMLDVLADVLASTGATAVIVEHRVDQVVDLLDLDHPTTVVIDA
jgi:hypothetical protein